MSFSNSPLRNPNTKVLEVGNTLNLDVVDVEGRKVLWEITSAGNQHSFSPRSLLSSTLKNEYVQVFLKVFFS